MPIYGQVSVTDRVALDEIDLYAEVLSAVAVSEDRLTPAQLDHVLGLCGHRPPAQLVPGGSGYPA